MHGRHAHRRHNPRIGAAAADVALHAVDNFDIARARLPGQQGNTAHDHAGRAIAALHGAGFEKRLLQWVQPAVMLQPLDGGDALAGSL